MPRDPFGGREEPALDEVLSALADEDCRALLEVMTQSLSASELSERSGIPLSTTYRKIERLEEASLINERIDIRDDGRHTSLYVPDFDRVEIARTEDESLTLDIIRPARTADERLEDLWTEVKKGV